MNAPDHGGPVPPDWAATIPKKLTDALGGNGDWGTLSEDGTPEIDGTKAAVDPVPFIWRISKDPKSWHLLQRNKMAGRAQAPLWYMLDMTVRQVLTRRGKFGLLPSVHGEVLQGSVTKLKQQSPRLRCALTLPDMLKSDFGVSGVTRMRRKQQLRYSKITIVSGLIVVACFLILGIITAYVNTAVTVHWAQFLLILLRALRLIFPSAYIVMCYSLFRWAVWLTHRRRWAAIPMLKRELQEYEHSREAYNRMLCRELRAVVLSEFRGCLSATGPVPVPRREIVWNHLASEELCLTCVCKQAMRELREWGAVVLGLGGVAGSGKTSALRCIGGELANGGCAVIQIQIHTSDREPVRQFVRDLAVRLAESFLSPQSWSTYLVSRVWKTWLSRLGRSVQSVLLLLVGAILTTLVSKNWIKISYAVKSTWFLVTSDWERTVPVVGLVVLAVEIVVAVVVVVAAVKPSFRRKWGGRKLTEPNMYREAGKVRDSVYGLVDWEMKKSRSLPKVLSKRPVGGSRKPVSLNRAYGLLKVSVEKLLESNVASDDPKELVILVDGFDELEFAADRRRLLGVLRDLVACGGVKAVVALGTDVDEDAGSGGDTGGSGGSGLFDTVIGTDEWSARATCEMLWRRDLEFPDGLAVFCHVAGLGNPRASLRVARYLVEKQTSPAKMALRGVLEREWGAARIDSKAATRAVARQLVALTWQQTSDGGETWRVTCDDGVYAQADALTQRAIAALR